MAIDRAALVDLIGRWWWNYDEGDFDALSSLLTEDVHFTCRTDTGQAEWEEFVRADITGRPAVMEWQVEHRANSPYPLRHNGSNVHVVSDGADQAEFGSYIHVTHMVGGMPALLPGGRVTGTVRVEAAQLLIAALHVVLDTVDSDVFSKARP